MKNRPDHYRDGWLDDFDAWTRLDYWPSGAQHVTGLFWWAE